MLGQQPNHGGGMNPEQPGRVGSSLLAGAHQCDDFLLLLLRQFGTSAPDTPVFPGGIEPALCPLAQHGTLELGE